jgi:hypothetical protein
MIRDHGDEPSIEISDQGVGEGGIGLRVHSMENPRAGASVAQNRECTNPRCP